MKKQNKNFLILIYTYIKKSRNIKGLVLFTELWFLISYLLLFSNIKALTKSFLK